MHEMGLDLKKVAKKISETFIYMIFEEGFVHSDPHPGNIFVRPMTMPDGTKDVQVVLLDHGIYTELNQ
jgi:aarF domain-containing kinase